MTIGGQFQALQNNYTNPDLGSVASFTFTNSETAGFSPTGTLLTATGNAYASYLLGAVNTSSITQNYVATTGGRYKTFAVYFQDDYKVTSRLTLNLGLRYDIFGTYHEVANRMSFLNPTLPNPLVSNYPGCLAVCRKWNRILVTATRRPDSLTQLGPRFGFAYSLNDKTVIRGGYAIMYAHGGATGGRAGARSGTGQLGFNANPTFTSPNPGAGAPAFFWSPAADPLPSVYSTIMRVAYRLISSRHTSIHAQRRFLHRLSAGKQHYLWRSSDWWQSALLSELESGNTACSFVQYDPYTRLLGQHRAHFWLPAWDVAFTATSLIRDIWFSGTY
jgi:hypothetical protein